MDFYESNSRGANVSARAASTRAIVTRSFHFLFGIVLLRTVFQCCPTGRLWGECLEETSERDRLEHADLRPTGYMFFWSTFGEDVSPNIIETRASDFVGVDRSEQLKNRVDFYILRFLVSALSLSL